MFRGSLLRIRRSVPDFFHLAPRVNRRLHLIPKGLGNELVETEATAEVGTGGYGHHKGPDDRQERGIALIAVGGWGH